MITGFMPAKSEANMMVGVPEFHDDITAIYGTGNPDNPWVTATTGDVTAGLRFRKRFTDYSPTDYLGTFYFDLDTEVNVDFSVSTGSVMLSNYYYGFGMDIDPAAGSEMFLPYFFDPILVLGDNSYGTSSTANGAGIEGSSLLASTNTVAQNSGQLSFFGIDTSVPGEYKSFLGIYTKGEIPELIAQTEVTVIISDWPKEVPDSGGTFALGALAIGGLIVAKSRVKKAA